MPPSHSLGILNSDLEVVNSSNATPLEEAVRYNCASSVKALLKAGANFDKPLFRGDIYLHIAATEGHNEALKDLLERGMDVNKKNHLGETPLVQAVKASRVQGIKLLREKGVGFSDLPGVRLKDGDSIVHSIACSGNVEILKLLKDRKIPANIKNQNGLTPLHVASNPTVLRMLLRMGVDVDSQDNTGSTSLMIAVRNSKEDIRNLLLLNGADPNIKDIEGRTALHYAAKRGYTGSMTTLLVAGARVDEKDDKGDTPTFIAAANNKPAILQLLVERALRDRNGDGIIGPQWTCRGLDSNA